MKLFVLPINIYVVLLSFIIALVACRKTEVIENTLDKPKPDFEFTTTNQGYLPNAVIFKNKSKGANSYLWFFDNGETSTIENPTANYTTAGIYNVKLIAANAAGKDSISKTISIVLDKPRAAFTYSILNDGEMPCRTKFTSQSTGAEKLKWYFGDGDTSSNANPEKVYDKSKKYLVKLVVDNASGTDSIEKEIEINPILYSVRVILVTPRDVKFNQLYYDAVKNCVINLQAWFKNQMGGKTFVLNNPIVDTVTGLHDSIWYYANNGAISGGDPRLYAFHNTHYDMQQLYGPKLGNLTKYVNLVYVASPGGGAGGGGFAALGDQDLKGLIGTNPDMPTVNRVIGGSGHELGHALGLPHPPTEVFDALMWTGLYSYPNCILLEADKAILNASPFFR